MTPSRLGSLQAARGVAALLVVLYHGSTAIFSLPKYYPHDPFHHAFASGRLGVELFFDVSGFVILSSHRNELSRPCRVLPFIKKRFLRIYPLYWLVLATLLPVYVAMPSFGDGSELRPLTILSSVALVHIGTEATILGVSWTLFFQILFYALFALLILDVRLGVAVLGCWWCLAAVHALSGTSLLAAYPFSDYTLLFSFGMAASFAYDRRLLRRPASLAIGGSAIFVLNGIDTTYAPILGALGVHLVAGMSGAVSLAGFAEMERRGRLHVPRVLTFLGDASYSIYLIHLPVLSLAAKILMPRLLQLFPPVVVASILILIAVAAGAGCRVTLERRLRELMMRGRRPSTRLELQPST